MLAYLYSRLVIFEYVRFYPVCAYFSCFPEALRSRKGKLKFYFICFRNNKKSQPSLQKEKKNSLHFQSNCARKILFKMKSNLIIV